MPIRAELRPRGPYSLRLSGRLASDATRVVVDGTYRATDSIRGPPRTGARSAACRRHDRGGGRQRGRRRACSLRPRSRRRPLGVPAPFRTATLSSARPLRRLRGLRPLRTGTVAQALLRAVAGQLIQASRARQIERAVIRAATPEHGGLHAPPACADLARFSPAELGRLGLGARRASCLIRLCRSFDLERLEGSPVERGRRPPRARAWARPVVCRRRLHRGPRPLRGRAGARPRAGQARHRALGPVGGAGGGRRPARAVRRVGRARERVPPGGLRPRSHTLATCRSRLSSTSSTTRPSPSPGSSPSRPRAAARSCSPAAPRSARPTSARPSSSPTGAARRSGGETSAASLPTTSSRTTALRRRPCSTGWPCTPRAVHRIRGELDPAAAAAEYDDGPRGRRARSAAPRPRQRRPYGVALPRVAAARGHGPPRDLGTARPRPLRRPGDDDPADHPRRAADRLPRLRRGKARRGGAGIRRRDQSRSPGEPREARARTGPGLPRPAAAAGLERRLNVLVRRAARATRAAARRSPAGARAPRARAPCPRRGRPRGTPSRVSNDGHHRFDCLAVADDIVRSDERERVGDVVREVVRPAQRIGEVPRVGPPRRARAARCVAAYRPIGDSAAAAPSSSAQFAYSSTASVVAREQRRLERADGRPHDVRPSPASQLSRQCAAARRSHSPAARVSGHQQGEPGGVRDVPLPDDRALVERTVRLPVPGLLLLGEGNPVHPSTLY